MQQITITVDMTPENLEILKQLCSADENKAPAKNEVKKTSKKATNKSASAEVTPGSTDTPETVAPSAPAETTETKVALADVRAVALKLSNAGKRDVLKAAFAKFGGSKLPDIKESDYAALMAELKKEVVDNA